MTGALVRFAVFVGLVALIDIFGLSVYWVVLVYMTARLISRDSQEVGYDRRRGN